jgi:hypothetical protein
LLKDPFLHNPIFVLIAPFTALLENALYYSSELALIFFILDSDITFSHCFPIIAIFLFEIISLSGDQRLAIIGGV